MVEYMSIDKYASGGFERMIVKEQKIKLNYMNEQTNETIGEKIRYAGTHFRN